MIIIKNRLVLTFFYNGFGKAFDLGAMFIRSAVWSHLRLSEGPASSDVVTKESACFLLTFKEPQVQRIALVTTSSSR